MWRAGHKTCLFLSGKALNSEASRSQYFLEMPFTSYYRQFIIKTLEGIVIFEQLVENTGFFKYGAQKILNGTSSRSPDADSTLAPNSAAASFRRENIRTSWPAARSSLTTLLPINPDPPVTTAFIGQAYQKICFPFWFPLSPGDLAKKWCNRRHR